MHILGLQGMPRRIYTYQPEMGWGPLNLLHSVGALILFASFVLFARQSRHERARGELGWRQSLGRRDAGMGHDLAAASLQFQPHPGRHPSRAALGRARDACRSPPASASTSRELIVSTVTEAVPQLRETSPGPSIWPLLAAIAVGGDLSRVDLHALGGGVGSDPGRDRADRLVLAEGHAGGRGMKQRAGADVSELPTSGFGASSPMWWGTLAFMAARRHGLRLGHRGLSLSASDQSINGRSM